MVVPYITAWSAERDLPNRLVERDGGVGYVNELLSDRDSHGVLWWQTAQYQGMGRPLFGKVHPMRQLRAMEMLLCQVCGEPADQDDDGVLWLQRDYRGDWPRWPEGMASVEPPICLPCVDLSRRMCPALRRGAVVMRVRDCPIVGVRGALYRPGVLGPVAVDVENYGYGDPLVRRVVASALVRELRGVTCE